MVTYDEYERDRKVRTAPGVVGIVFRESTFNIEILRNRSYSDEFMSVCIWSLYVTVHARQ